MSNTYDIDIQMNYFLSGDDYDSSLKSLQEFKRLLIDTCLIGKKFVLVENVT